LKINPAPCFLLGERSPEALESILRGLPLIKTNYINGLQNIESGANMKPRFIFKAVANNQIISREC
jgi:hypothetical protein